MGNRTIRIHTDRGTLVECEAVNSKSRYGNPIGDLHVSINVKNFALILPKLVYSYPMYEVLDDFERIQDLRGEYHEVHVACGGPPDAILFARDILVGYAQKYNLGTSED